MMQNDGRRAGFGMRAICFAMDTLGLSLLLALIDRYILVTSNTREYPMILTILSILYFFLLPVLWKGYTISKYFGSIRIAKVNEEPLTAYHLFMREVIGRFLLGFTTFGISNLISAFMVMFREDKRAIHDFIAGTFVVKVK
ncbi:RDD family protein [Fictibacillus fluitans]|uniref:RDD family protein n=1 Tax=Fictibacillus fluitans TaxID=3058422 RepID=A0ABT8I0W2_9BACL|nr:RDD family protein [Fictibacillus sp. NE201]MDN4526609.1 RDD family protein [Fictibacillus sp. NE201]